MFTVNFTKKQIRKHNGTMTVEVGFQNETESFTKMFEFPIYATLGDMKKTVKAWIEDYEENTALVLDPSIRYDLADVVTDRVAEREYELKKVQLAEMRELVALGALSSTDTALKALQGEVKTKFKPEFIKSK